MATKSQELTDLIATAIETGLKTTPGLKVLRNHPLQYTVKEDGYVNIVDPANIEKGTVTLGIIQYYFTMRVYAVIVTTGRTAVQKKENIIQQVASAVTMSSDLKSRVDRLEVEAPETMTENIADAAKVRVTILPIFVGYSTPNSMG